MAQLQSITMPSSTYFPALPSRSPSLITDRTSLPLRLAALDLLVPHNGSRTTCSFSQCHRSQPVLCAASFSSARTDLSYPSASAASSTVSSREGGSGHHVRLADNVGGGNGAGSYNGGGGSGGGGGWGGEGGENEPKSREGGGGGFLGAFLRGWQARVRTDPQFPFKVLMEEVIGVGACVLGDMASRPNFGLNELDFVFSTVVVGSILNFTLMYMLAPTSIGSAVHSLPGIFTTCPSGHMFESGAYTLLDRSGTFVYKGTLFAAVGFGAGLVGTFMSTFLLAMRKRMDPTFEAQNKPPPTLLNAATWAIHMGLSSNLRYQALNGLEFTLAKFLNPTAFRASVFVTRGLNNVLGGVSFVTLARLTGSQKTDEVKSSSSPSPSGSQEDNDESQPAS